MDKDECKATELKSEDYQRDYSKLDYNETAKLHQELLDHKTSIRIEDRLQKIGVYHELLHTRDSSDTRVTDSNSALLRIRSNKAIQEHKPCLKPLKQKATVNCVGRHQTRANLSHRTFSHLFTLIVCLVLLLSLCGRSLSAQSFTWDKWNIEDTSPAASTPTGHSASVLTDLVAISGQLFLYQIPDNLFGSSPYQFQVREAGRNKLPDWLSFSPSSSTILGVPLETDQGTLYISVDVYSSNGKSTMPVFEDIFYIKVIPPRTSTPDNENESQLVGQFNKTNCPNNFYLSEKALPSLHRCSDEVAPILASIITYPNMEKLSGIERASVLLSFSEFLGICASSVSVENTGWSTSAKMKIWSHIAESGLSEYLESTSTISLSLSCNTTDYRTNKEVDSILQLLDRVVLTQSATQDLSESVIYLKWFVSSGVEVLEKSALGRHAIVNNRLRRQIDVEELPVIDVTTTSPDVASSSTSSISLSSLNQGAVESSISQAGSTFSILSRSLFSTPGIDLNPTSTVSIRPGLSITDSVIDSTDVLFSTSTAVDMPETSAEITGIPQSRVVLIPTNSAETDFDATIDIAAPISSQLIGPSSRVVPLSEPTLILTPSFTIFPSPSPSSQDFPSSSELGPENDVTSFAVMSVMVSEEQSFLTSQPVFIDSVSPSLPLEPSSSSPLFSIPSTIEDLQTVAPSFSSLFFLLSSSLDLLLPSSSVMMLMPESSTATTPTQSLLSSSAFFSSSRAPPDFSSSEIVLMPETSILAPFSSPVFSLRPTSSQVFQKTTQFVMESSAIAPEFSSSDMILPDLTSLFIESTLLIQPSSTMIELFPTNIVPFLSSDLFSPETSAAIEQTPSDVISRSIPGSSSVELVFTSSIEVFMPTIETTPSDLSTTVLPEVSSSLFSSSISSSNNLLMPMSTEELTLSISIFTPSLLLSISPSPSSFMSFFSMPPSPVMTPVMTDILIESSSVVETFVSTTVEALPEPSTTVHIFPETSFVFVESSSLQPFSSLLVSHSSEEFLSESFVPQTSDFVLFQTSEVEFFSPTFMLPTLTTTMADFTTHIFTSFLLSSLHSFRATSLYQPSLATSAPSPSSLPPSTPSITPSPSPMLSFCEIYDIDCSGNGVCIGDGCNCYPDYTGVLCKEIIDDCDSNPCFYRFTNSCIDGNSTAICICNQGYTGLICDEEIDGCLPSPCSLNATCVNLPMGEFFCNCPIGFTGEFCEDEIDPCDPNPCLDNEICIATDAVNFTCIEIASPLVFTPTTSVTSIFSTSSISSSFVLMDLSSIDDVSSILSSSQLLPSATTSISLSQTLIPSPPASSLTPSSPQPAQSLTPPFPSVPSLTSSAPPVSSLTPSSPPVPSLTPSPLPVPNESPILLNPIGTLIVNMGQVFQFSIPEETFYDTESGSTSFLSLTLLNYRGERLPNSTWIQLNKLYIEGLPLSSEIFNDAITDHFFILQARDSAGSLAHDFVTIRVIPLGPFSTFLTVLFENEYEILSRNVTQKIDLVQRLSSATTPPSIMLSKRQTGPPILYSSGEIYIRDIFNTNPLEVSYKNLSIPDLNCEEFYAWIEGIYNFTSNEYTLRFIQAMEPEFHPTPTPRIEGVCRLMTSNIPPIIIEEVDVSDADISQRDILLITVLPAAGLALCYLLCGLCALCMYRRIRAERKYVTSRRIFLNRRPIILEGETAFPDRRVRPFILENDFALEREGSSDEEDELSEISVMPPQAGVRERLLRDPFASPPAYRLPPLYTHRQSHDTSLQNR